MATERWHHRPTLITLAVRFRSGDASASCSLMAGTYPEYLRFLLKAPHTFRDERLGSDESCDLGRLRSCRSDRTRGDACLGVIENSNGGTERATANLPVRQWTLVAAARMPLHILVSVRCSRFVPLPYCPALTFVTSSTKGTHHPFTRVYSRLPNVLQVQVCGTRVLQ